MKIGVIAGLLSTVVCASCTPGDDRIDASDFPYKFVRSDSVQLHRTYVDLDGDGAKECIALLRQSNPVERSAIFVEAADGSLIDQVNFFGAQRVDPWFTYDADRDGDRDIWCTVARGESLFAEVVDGYHSRHSRPLLSILLYAPPPPAAGAPVVQPGASSADVSARLWGIVKSSRGNRKYLLASVSAGYARRPRTLSAYEIPSGKPVWTFACGVSPRSIAVAESGPDSLPRLFLGTGAPDNGASEGGFDDAHSYVIALTLEGRVAWSREMGGRFSSTSVCLDELDADGRPRLAAYFYAGNRGGRASAFEEMSPATGGILVHKEFTEPMASCNDFVTLGRNRRSHRFTACTQRGDLTLFDENLAPVRTVKLGQPAASISVGGVLADEEDDITVYFESGEAEVFTPDLVPVALLPRGEHPDDFLDVSLPTSKPGEAHMVVLAGGAGSIVGRLEANPSRTQRFLFFAVIAAVAAVAAGAAAYGLFRAYLYIDSYRRFSQGSERIGLMVIGRRGTIRSANEALRRFMAIPAGEWRGRRWQSVFAGPAYRELAAYLAGSTAPQSVTRIDLSLDFKDLDLVVRSFPLSLGRLRFGSLIVISDITDLLKADRIMNWALVAQNLAHEMKTPLSTIWFTLERMRQAHRTAGTGDAGGEELHFRSIEEEIKRLDRYVKGLMKLANLSAPSLQRMALNDLLRDHLTAYARKLPSSVCIEVDFNEALPPVDLDVNLFTSALDNILDNAVTAMKGEGTMKVETYVAQDLKEEWVCSAVADTGSGIPEADIPKMFQPYFTRTNGGTGLGLVITKKIVEDHGGKITFTTQVGLGSRFVIHWPPAGRDGVDA